MMDSAQVKILERRAVDLITRSRREGKWIGQRNGMYVLLLLHTGMRASEVLSLAVEDIDEASSAIKKPRSIEYPPVLADELDKYLSWFNHTQSDFVLWGNRVLRSPLSRRRADEMLEELMDRWGYDFLAHDFRKSWGQRKWKECKDLEVLASSLGLTKIEYAERYT